MPIRYYPSFRIKTDLITNGSQYRTINGPYKGKYYIAYDGRTFSGANPIVGPNEELFTYDQNEEVSQEHAEIPISNEVRKIINSQTKTVVINAIAKRGVPTPYFPVPTEGDYKKGYVLRSFIKKNNDRGLVTEISNEEYANFSNGTVDYDISFYQSLQLLWKLTGPLNNTRLGQYEVRAGIIDTNKRLVENANKTFLGITEFIGGEYAKFARPTL
jgi:hypothetical protein